MKKKLTFIKVIAHIFFIKTQINQTLFFRAKLIKQWINFVSVMKKITQLNLFSKHLSYFIVCSPCVFHCLGEFSWIWGKNVIITFTNLKVLLTLFPVFISNYLSYNIMSFCESLFVFGQMLYFFRNTLKLDRFPPSWFKAASWRRLVLNVNEVILVLNLSKN